MPQEQHGAKGSSFVVRSMFGWGGGGQSGGMNPEWVLADWNVKD